MSKGFFAISEDGVSEHRMTIEIAMQIDPAEFEELRSDVVFVLLRHNVTNSGKNTPLDALAYYSRKERAQ